MADDTTHVLLVDDLPDKLLAYRSILEGMDDLTLVTARSGEEALGLILRQDFAVVLLDVQMPGMDGLETAALIRKRRRSAHTPIIFLTAFADEVRVAEGYAQGAVDYISTPVVPDILRAKVRVFVDLHRMTQQVKKQAEERVVLAEERSKRAAAEEANRRLAFLAEASKALAGSLDPQATAQALARLTVPTLADLAGLTLAMDPHRPWQTELAWSFPPDPEVYTRWLAADEGPQDGLREAVDRALATGKPEQLDGLDISYPAAPGRPAPAGHRLRSAAVFPLQARGRTLGALTLALGASGRRHTPADLAMAADLASRAAVALDNARLHHEVQQADRQKNEFLSMLAHELRNPLAPIRNAAEILRLKGPDVKEVRWAREVIERQLAHLVRLVDDLLDVSRITRGKIRLQVAPVNLADVVAQAVEASRPAIEGARHEFEVALPPAAVWVDGDAARLAQVVTNLLNNAAKYTEPGGRIWLTVGREGGEAVVRVRDTGVGIPADMLGSVFEPFTQVDRSLDRSQGGLGIGLTLVKRLVEMHGGAVGVHSDGPGTGSEFTVRLPASAGEGRVGEEGTTADGSTPPPRLKVLLVDDNVDAADSLAALLRLAGHDVRVSHDGPTAVEAAAEARPDLVLLDIGLPGLNGYDVARQLRARAETRGVVLLAVTGYGRDEDRRLAREAGFDHHLTKPVEFDDLQRVLAAVCRRSRNGSPGGS